jgi:RimJ/RimL family protein N-acetyltransferase
VTNSDEKDNPLTDAALQFELQPTIENRWVKLEPLAAGDFEALFSVASDPLIWEQHPNKDRYQRDTFATYFKGAIESGGAFRVIDNSSGTLIGSSRYYDLDGGQSIVGIGYTFLARSHWGGQFNRALKTLMLEHAFRFVERVIFHVGIGNWRSRRAMEKLGGILIGEVAIPYYGEPSRQNVVFKIDAADWVRSKAANAIE